MRLLTFSVLKNCKAKHLYRLSPRKLCVVQADDAKRLPLADAELVEIERSWAEHDEPGLRAGVVRDMRVYPHFVTPAEEAALLAELEPYLKRMRYEFDHWDNAIEGYRETERSKWSQQNEGVLQRVKDLAFSEKDAGSPLAHTHVLDLAAAGYIRPHVDAVRFCGEVIAGICLHSSAVMLLQHVNSESRKVRVLLPARCLYVMRGVARYEFSHAVLRGEESEWRGQMVPRKRRVAVITRSQPKPV